jgi:hypothetical protein
MRVACEPLPMRPITKHLPEPLRPCHCCPPALSPVNRPTGLPPTWQVSEREERKTGSSGTSRMVTSLRHVIYLPAELFPFLAILLVCRRTTTCISYYYSTTVPMHLHIITTSPQKGPTRPAAAPRELLQSDLLTVYPPYLDVNRRGRQAIRDVLRACQGKKTASSVLSRTNYQTLQPFSPKRLQPPGGQPRYPPAAANDTKQKDTSHIINSQISHVQVDAASAIRTMHVHMCAWPLLLLYP